MNNKVVVTFSNSTVITDDILSYINDNVKDIENCIIFSRSRRVDNIFKNKFLRYDTRVVQFRADWYEDNIHAGEKRNEKIFSFPKTIKCIVYTTKDENNKEGLETIQWKSYTLGIPLTVITDGVVTFDGSDNYPITEKPVCIEEKTDRMKNFMDIHSKEYKEKLNITTRRYKKIYYEGLKERPTIKMYDELKGPKPKCLKMSKAKTKRNIKKVKKNNAVTLDEELFEK